MTEQLATLLQGLDQTEILKGSGAAFQESTKPLLRPHLLAKLEDEKQRLDGLLNAPPYIANQIQGRAELARRLSNLNNQIETQRPHPYEAHEIDGARVREQELLADILDGMPTAAEMRRTPGGPGGNTVGKHRAWDNRKKAQVLEWKNIRLRRHAGGDLDHTDGIDVANIEAYRPIGGSGEANMDDAMIPGKLQFGPKPGAAPTAVMAEAESALLATINPELHGMMALLSNENRTTVLALVRGLIADAVDGPGGNDDESEPVPGVSGGEDGVSQDVPTASQKARAARKTKGKGWTTERRRAASVRMKAMMAEKRMAKETAAVKASD